MNMYLLKFSYYDFQIHKTKLIDNRIECNQFFGSISILD